MKGVKGTMGSNQKSMERKKTKNLYFETKSVKDITTFMYELVAQEFCFFGWLVLTTLLPSNSRILLSVETLQSSEV